MTAVVATLARDRLNPPELLPPGHTFAGLRRNGYRAAYIDPPWAFQTWSGRGKGKGAEQHYDTMSLAELMALPVADLLAPDAAVFMWIVQSHADLVAPLMQAWGHKFKTVAYAWVKIKGPQPMLFVDQGATKKGMGYHTRAGFEQCWLGTRGRGYSRLSKREPQVTFALDPNADPEVYTSPLREHSRKPDEIRESIERLVGNVPRVELFARTRNPGWDAWGKEIDKFGSDHGTETQAAGRSAAGHRRKAVAA